MIVAYTCVANLLGDGRKSKYRGRHEHEIEAGVPRGHIYHLKVGLSLLEAWGVVAHPGQPTLCETAWDERGGVLRGGVGM